MSTLSANRLSIVPATRNDLSLILALIKELAEYEQLAHEVVATEEVLSETLFGERPYAEVVLAYYDDEPVGYALYFHSYSTFLGRPGSISRICSYDLQSGGRESGRLFWHSWPISRLSEHAAGSSGRY